MHLCSKCDLHQDVHWECKNIQDSLRKMAKRQHEQDWWTSVQHDDLKLAAVIKRYKIQTADTRSSAKKGAFQIAAYKQVYEAADEILKDGVGEMMDETQFISHMMQRPSEKMTAPQAKVAWDAMEAEPSKHFHDKDGPGGAYRFRVKIKDIVTFRSRHTTSRQCELAEKPIKAPEAQAIQRMQSRVNACDNQAFGSADDFTEMAKAMCASGSGMDDDQQFAGAFMGANLHNIRSLADDEEQPQVKPKDDSLTPADEEPHADNNATAASGKRGILKSPAKPSKPEDETSVADACSRAQRLWAKSVDQLQEALNGLSDQALTVLRESYQNRESPRLRNAYALCDVRTAFGLACLFDSCDRLDTLVNEFKANQTNNNTYKTKLWKQLNNRIELKISNKYNNHIQSKTNTNKTIRF